MDTRTLKEYVDICESIKDAELELERMQGSIATVECDKVKGSMQGFPYIETSFLVEGAVENRTSSAQINKQRERIETMKRQKTKVDTWISRAPARMQRIIQYKCFDRLSWEQVADRMGRGATGDSIRMEFKRYLKKN